MAVDGDGNGLAKDNKPSAETPLPTTRAIARAIGVAPTAILFLSYVVEELNAARTAGMQTIGLVRNGPLGPAASHHQVKDFDAIIL